MKKIIIIALSLIAVLSAGCAADQDKAAIKGEVQNNIISSNSTAAGKIVEMKVEQGQSVKKGDIIAVIDNTNQKYIVDQMQAVVNIKQAKLEELRAGTRPEQIDQAQAQVNAARSQVNVAKDQLAKIAGGARAEEVASAQAVVDQAKASLSGAQIGKANLRDSLDTAESNYCDLLKSMSSFKDSEGDYSPDAALAELDNMLAAKLITEAQYTEKVNYINQLFSNKAQLEAAIDQLEGQIKVAYSQIDALDAGVNAAESQLGLISAGAASYDVKILEDQVKTAQANYDAAAAQLNLLKSGATSQALAAAQADLDQATAQLNQAKYALDNCSIIALADGIVISRNYQLGDIVTAGSNIADIAMDDIYVLCYVPVKYLDRVSYGQELEVKTSLGTRTGRVTYLDLESEYTPKDMQSDSDSEQESVKMKVSIEGEAGKLKSGMSAEVAVPLK
ncbi:MAG: multidrug resistance efflux pump [Firmicutes bacterium]|nr:multidrug resistance efflux pump [Bacillota bacterium]